GGRRSHLRASDPRIWCRLDVALPQLQRDVGGSLRSLQFGRALPPRGSNGPSDDGHHHGRCDRRHPGWRRKGIRTDMTAMSKTGREAITAATPIRVQIEGLSKTFRSTNSKVRVLDNLSLD